MFLSFVFLFLIYLQNGCLPLIFQEKGSIYLQNIPYWQPCNRIGIPSVEKVLHFSCEKIWPIGWSLTESKWYRWPVDCRKWPLCPYPLPLPSLLYVGWLVEFYGKSTIVTYLMPNPLYIKYIWLVNTFCR